MLDKEVFDIHEVIKNTAASFEGICTKRRISIELLLAARHLNVYADRKKIQQVLYNLIDNAVKFSDADSSITIETTDRGDKVYISVKDYGIGIPRESLNKIWGALLQDRHLPRERQTRHRPWTVHRKGSDPGAR